ILRMQDKYLREWNLHGPPAWVTASYNIAPTQQVPIMRMENGAPAAAMVRWGLIPGFAHGTPGKFGTINARIETVGTAASFRGALHPARIGFLRMAPRQPGAQDTVPDHPRGSGGVRVRRPVGLERARGRRSHRKLRTHHHARERSPG